MTETYTGGSVKISCPSNYAENRRGAEVTLHYALPEGTTCEQADEATTRVRRLCLKHVCAAQSDPISSNSDGASGSSVSAVATLSPAPVPEKTAGSSASETKRKPKPSDIVIGATSTPATATLAPTADAPTPAPVVAVPTAPPPAPQAPAFVMPGASPSIPASTGTEPVNGAPFAPAPVVAASLSAADETATAGGIDDLGLRKLVGREITRINQIAPGQGGNVVNSITAEFVAPPGGLLSIPMADRERFVATLAAWQGCTA